MERALNKILDIISDMSCGNIDDDAIEFLRGYLVALMDNKEITRDEFLMLMRFYCNLIRDKVFIAEAE